MDCDVVGPRLDTLHGDGDVAPDGVVVGLDEGDETHPVVLRLQVARQSHVGDLLYGYFVSTAFSSEIRTLGQLVRSSVSDAKTV